jgi:hypothetical protein
MRPFYRHALAALFVIYLALPADAQDSFRPGLPTADSARARTTLTGKERLGQKWSDEQRVDNCKVPVDKRGSRPRPSECPHIPMN